MKRSRLTSAVLLVLASSVAAFSYSAGTARADDPVPVREFTWSTYTVTGTSKVAVPAGSSPDAEIHAKLQNLDPAIAAADLAKQVAFENIATRIQIDHPEKFVEAGFGGAKRTGWIALTTKPSAAVEDLLRDLGEVEIRYGAPTSAEEADRFTEQLLTAVIGAGLSKTPHADMDLQSMTLSVGLENPPIEVTGAATNRVLQDLAVKWPEGKLPVTVTMAATTEGAEPEATTVGGAHLTVGTSVVCTSGFSVSGGGQQGIVTARHCQNSLGYQGTSGIISFTREAETGAGDDIQFHRTLSGHSATNVIYTRRNGGSRTITSWANPVTGATVCHMGYITAVTKCTVVLSGTSSRTDNGYPVTGLRKTRDYVSAKGNSGGPWYINNAARGVHSGSIGDPPYSSTFEIIQRLALLGLSVKTS